MFLYSILKCRAGCRKALHVSMRRLNVSRSIRGPAELTVSPEEDHYRKGRVLGTGYWPF